MQRYQWSSHDSIILYRYTFSHAYIPVEPPTPPIFLQPEVIAESTNRHAIVYRFTWLRTNNERCDLNHVLFQINEQPPIIIMNSTELTLPLSYGKHNVSIIAVDRCNQQSPANALAMDVQPVIERKCRLNTFIIPYSLSVQ